MRLNKATSLLLALNLVLVAAVLILVWRVTILDDRPPAIRVVTNEVATLPAPIVTNVIVTNDFQWHQLESEDYRSYIERLRKIGCPEQTIRDIIIADLDKLMAPRVQGSIPRRKNLQFWHSEDQEVSNEVNLREALRQQQEIDFEKRQVIQELMGADLVAERMAVLGQDDYYGRRLEFLPTEKKTQVRMLLEKYRDRESAYQESAWEEQGGLSREDRGELRRIRQEKEAEVAKLLTPEEKEHYDLWFSPTASSIRQSTYGMDATQTEFMKVYQLQREFDQQWDLDRVNLSDDSVREQYEAAQAQLREQIQSSLGDERYAQFERGSDPEFHQLNATVTRFNLPRETASQAYELKRIADEQRAVVAAKPDLDPQLGQIALEAIAEETEREIVQLMGERAYRHYRRNGDASWVKPASMQAAPADEPAP